MQKDGVAESGYMKKVCLIFNHAAGGKAARLNIASFPWFRNVAGIQTREKIRLQPLPGVPLRFLGSEGGGWSREEGAPHCTLARRESSLAPAAPQQPSGGVLVKGV